MRDKSLERLFRSAMHLGALGAAILLLSPSPAAAQYGMPGIPGMGGMTGMGGIPGMGGMPRLGGGGFGTPAARQLNRPLISPYLNLLQPGLDPAITYQTMIRPGQQLRNTLALQGQMIEELDRYATSAQGQLRTLRRSSTPSPSEFPQTGHPTTFLQTGSFFPGMPGQRR